MSYSSKQIRSTITADGTLELSLVDDEVTAPGPDEVVVQVQAAPINPSDLGLLFGPANMREAQAVGSADAPRITAPVSPKVLPALAARIGKAMPVGNEGAGVVVATGDSPDAKALMGKTVSFAGGGSFSQYRKLHRYGVQPLPEGTTAEEGASWFVNPMTAMCMLETMRADGHTALVHTAAASNLGQMLCKLCLEDGVELVNIVRRPEQEALLRELGAKHVVDTSQEDFKDRLLQAVRTTSATVCFDAIGGGRLGSQVLSAMERAASAEVTEYSTYGTDVYKQLYVYGALDPSPIQLDRNFGFSWGVAGWLLTPTLKKVGRERTGELRVRAVQGLKTTFASHYTQRITLTEALSLEAVAGYAKQATGSKYLLTPNI